MADERDEVRARIDIVELVGQRVQLKRAGRHFKGLCPFHQDKNPSFTVDPTTGRYKCWSCGEAGDVFTWVMKTQNVDFVEALKELAARAGVTLAQRGTPVPPSVREAHRGAMAEALAFYREQLVRSSTAQEYIKRRGLDEASLEEWQMGYAPDAREALTMRLKRAGFPLAECKNLFLVDQDASGGYYDKFHGRLMFPIHDEKGELVAFGGRLLGDGHPKYINSSDTPLYRKSRVLYGMNRARDHFGKERRAVLVEGYLDVIACHRAGARGALASLGTSLSEDHAKLLKRWVDEVVILYDSDDAGRKAADRAIGILTQEGLVVRVALMPPGDDPDTLLRRDGPAAVRRSIEAGVPPQEYRLQSLRQRRSPSEPEFWAEAVDILSNAVSDLEAATNLQLLASEYPGVKDQNEAIRVLKRMVEQSRQAKRAAGPKGEARPVAVSEVSIAVPMSAAERVVFQSLHEPSFQRFAWLTIINSERSDLFSTSTARGLSTTVRAAFPSGPPDGPASGWIHRLEPETMRQAFSDLLFDYRPELVSEAVLADSIELLRRQAERRQLELLRQGNLTADQRQETLQRIRRLKPDRLNVPRDEDEDPFA